MYYPERSFRLDHLRSPDQKLGSVWGNIEDLYVFNVSKIRRHLHDLATAYRSLRNYPADWRSLGKVDPESVANLGRRSAIIDAFRKTVGCDLDLAQDLRHRGRLYSRYHDRCNDGDSDQSRHSSRNPHYSLPWRLWRARGQTRIRIPF
jgi:hypothetical protein